MATHDSNPGWLSTVRDKALLFFAAAAGFLGKETVLESFEAITQVVSRERSTVRSPEEMPMTGRITTSWRQAVVNSIPFAPWPAARHARLRASFQGERVGKVAAVQGRRRPGIQVMRPCNSGG